MCSSGRQWERLGGVALPDSTNQGFWVVDRDDPTVRAWFKFLNPLQPLKSSLYSFGVERAVVTLARSIDLPVPEVYLEEIEGQPGLVSRMVPGQAWETLADETVRRVIFSDREAWTTYCAFDVLAGNHDRHSRNIYVEWNPPLRRLPAEGEQAALWLIDFGWSGLWPVYKFGAGLRASDLETVSPDTELLPDFATAIRNNMPPKIRNNIALRGTPEREQAIANLRRITDDAIEAAVTEIPDTYMTDRAAQLTTAFLCRRLGRIVTLVDAVFPT